MTQVSCSVIRGSCAGTPSALLAAVASALLALSCQSSEAAPLDSASRFRYSGEQIEHVEQPESASDCGRTGITYDTSGYFTLDRSAGRVRLDGFGCTLDVAEAGSSITADAQPCMVDGPVSFQGVSIEKLDFEAFAIDLDAGTAAWRVRASRALPNGRFVHCFEVDGVVEPR
jgi:hypothetical protein